ncbi:metal-sulfur cluster assembly factor [Azohydromonas sediminis]|uniref:metal-sulfur cluster assembly factor n=1 Tax=Azohydromonas sediminis TaxID=2259674 RepID=UPI000E64E29B|nr:metal-sulfur cluster assembly factor [Azohydromonas sediminis]
MDCTATPALDDAAVLAALRDVFDPEIGENVVDLGLVEAIAIEPGHVRVTLLPTSATCPMADLLLDEAEEALGRLAALYGLEAEAVIDWDGVWDPQRMSPALRERFGW